MLKTESPAMTTWLFLFCPISFLPPSHMLTVPSCTYRRLKLKAYRFDDPLQWAADGKRNSCPHLSATKWNWRRAVVAWVPDCPAWSAVSAVDARLNTLQIHTLKPKKERTLYLLVQRYVTTPRISRASHDTEVVTLSNSLVNMACITLPHWVQQALTHIDSCREEWR